MRHVVIPSWYQRPGYVRAMADLIQAELLRPGQFPAVERDAVQIFFSAHGVPVSYIEEGAWERGGARRACCGHVVTLPAPPPLAEAPFGSPSSSLA